MFSFRRDFAYTCIQQLGLEEMHYQSFSLLRDTVLMWSAVKFQDQQQPSRGHKAQSVDPRVEISLFPKANPTFRLVHCSALNSFCTHFFSSSFVFFKVMEGLGVREFLEIFLMSLMVQQQSQILFLQQVIKDLVIVGRNFKISTPSC